MNKNKYLIKKCSPTAETIKEHVCDEISPSINILSLFINEKKSSQDEKVIEQIFLNKVKDNFQAFLVEGATFVGEEDYPLIEWWMVPQEPPKKVIPFNKITKGQNLNESYICFYIRDEDLLKITRNPKKYLPMFKRAKGIIGFDLSIHEDMPLAKQKAQMYNNQALTYYFGLNGIPVIPNIRYGSKETIDAYLSSVTKNSLIALGTYGFIKTTDEQNVWFKVITNAIQKLEPSGIVVYGSLPLYLENWCQINGIPTYIYESHTSLRMKEVKINERSTKRQK